MQTNETIINECRNLLKLILLRQDLLNKIPTLKEERGFVEDILSDFNEALGNNNNHIILDSTDILGDFIKQFDELLMQIENRTSVDLPFLKNNITFLKEIIEEAKEAK